MVVLGPLPGIHTLMQFCLTVDQGDLCDHNGVQLK